MIATIFTLVVFVFVVLIIATEKLNRAIVSLLGAAILFIFLILYAHDIFVVLSFPWKIDLLETSNLLIIILDIPTPQKIFLILFQNDCLTPFNFSHLINFMIGTKADNFNNIHSIILILGIMIQVNICHEAGVFQFLALKLAKRARGNPKTLFLICSLLAVLLSSILNNILTLILLIPLTIMICRILNINPIPYILGESLLVSIGCTMFLISSIQSILISQAAGLYFIDYLANTAWFAFILFAIAFLIVRKYLKKEFKVPEKKLVKVLEEFNPWNFVSDKKLFYKSIICLFVTYILIIFLPEFPDTVAITVSIILVIISKLKTEEIIKSIDFELILYLIGIFIIIGCLEYVGIIDAIGFALKGLAGGSPGITTQIVLWISAFLSSSIDTIPITNALIPIMPILTFGFNPSNMKITYFALNLGVVLGDTLTPMGDTIIVMKLTKKQGIILKFKEFFKIGFFIGIIELAITSLYFGIRLLINF